MSINNNNIKLVGNFDAKSVGIKFWETLMFICMQNINLILNLFFLDFVKTLQARYFGNFDNA